MADVIDWLGQSGKTYRYWFLAQMTAESIKAEGGNYLFAKHLGNNRFIPLYVGETDNLSTRLSGHDRWEEAKKAGATHVMTYTTPTGEGARKAEERDLIQKWSPLLNVQHRKWL